MIGENDLTEEEFTLSDIEGLPLSGRVKFIEHSKININELKKLIKNIEAELDCDINYHQNLSLLTTFRITLAVNNVINKIKAENPFTENNYTH